MSQLRLYLDEDAMRRSLVFGLRSRGIDLVTAHEAGLINQPDEVHLRSAAELGRALYTFNVADYCLLHDKWLSESRPHSGIIICRQQRHTFREELRGILRLVSRLSSVDMQNRIEFLSTWLADQRPRR